MKKFSLIALSALLAAGVSGLAAGEIQIDQSHSKVEFTVAHMMLASVTGRFDKFEATSKFDEKTGLLSDLNVKIKTESVNTNDEKRDGHLKSDDFFSADKNPEITFVNTAPVTLRKGVPTRVAGNLTIKGVTKPVALTVTYKGSLKDPWGNLKHIFEGNTKISRKDFGITWNKPLDGGGVIVGDEVAIQIAAEAAAKK